MVQRIATWARREPRVATGWALLWLVQLIALWWPRHLLVGASPDQLAGVVLWQRLGDAAAHVDRFYAAGPLPASGWGWLVPLRLLGALVGVEVAARLLLSIYAAALPAALALFARRFHRSPLLVALASPFILHHDAGRGLAAWTLALPLVLATLALLDAQLERPTRARLVGLVALTVAVLSLDALALLLLAFTALVVVLARADAPLARGRAAMTGGLLLGAIVLELAAVRVWTPQALPHLPGAHGEKVIESAMFLPSRLLTNWPGNSDDAMLLVLAAVWLVLASTAVAEGDAAAEGEPSSLRRWVPEVCFGICVAGYFVLSQRTYQPLDGDPIAPRLLAPATFFGALLVRGPLDGWRRWLLAPALACGLIYPLLLTAHLAALDGRMAPVDRLLGSPALRGTATLTINRGAPDDTALDLEMTPWLSVPARAVLAGAAYHPYLDVSALPLRVVRRLPAPPRARPLDLPSATVTAWDHVLIVRVPGATPSPPSDTDLVERAGDAALFKVRK